MATRVPLHQARFPIPVTSLRQSQELRSAGILDGDRNQKLKRLLLAELSKVIGDHEEFRKEGDRRLYRRGPIPFRAPTPVQFVLRLPKHRATTNLRGIKDFHSALRKCNLTRLKKSVLAQNLAMGLPEMPPIDHVKLAAQYEFLDEHGPEYHLLQRYGHVLAHKYGLIRAVLSTFC